MEARKHDSKGELNMNRSWRMMPTSGSTKGCGRYLIVLLLTFTALLAGSLAAASADPIKITIDDDDKTGLSISRSDNPGATITVPVGKTEVIPPPPQPGKPPNLFTVTLNVAPGPTQTGIVFFTEPGLDVPPNKEDDQSISDALQVSVTPGSATTTDVGIRFSSDPDEVSYIKNANKIMETGMFQTIRGSDLSLLDSDGKVMAGNFNLPDGITIQVRSDAVLPEPSTLTLLGIGTFGLLGYGRRRYKRVT
jgi:hypothetical protein